MFIHPHTTRTTIWCNVHTTHKTVCLNYYVVMWQSYYVTLLIFFVVGMYI